MPEFVIENRKKAVPAAAKAVGTAETVAASEVGSPTSVARLDTGPSGNCGEQFHQRLLTYRPDRRQPPAAGQARSTSSVGAPPPTPAHVLLAASG